MVYYICKVEGNTKRKRRENAMPASPVTHARDSPPLTKIHTKVCAKCQLTNSKKCGIIIVQGEGKAQNPKTPTMQGVEKWRTT